MEPRTEQEDRKRRILALRWELNIDPEAHYTLEELEEMYHEQD
jgi:hypothetical protein